MTVGFESPRHQGWHNAKSFGEAKAMAMNPYPTAGVQALGIAQPGRIAKATSSVSFEYIDGVKLFREGKHFKNSDQN